MGGYERDPAPWQDEREQLRRDPGRLQRQLLPEDWTRLEEIAQNSQRRVPAMGEVGVRTFINGPEAFTPDNEFCLGETEVAGFFVAAGFCAHGIAGAGGIGKVMAEWIVAGEPSMDLWHMDINRFGRQYRSPSFTLKRTVENYQTYYDIAYPGSPAPGRPAAAHVAGLRVAQRPRRVLRREGRLGAGRVLRAATPRARLTLTPRWAGPDATGRPRPAAEHRATRDRGRPVRRDVVRQDRGERAGRGDPAELGLRQRRRPRRSATSPTPRRSTRRGGIEADFTVTRTGRRRVHDRHRHGVRHPRPGLAAQAGPAPRARTCASPTSPARWSVTRCGVRAPATCWRD